MLEIRVQIEAPELTNAMLALAAAMSGKSIDTGITVNNVATSTETPKSDKPSRSNRSAAKPETAKEDPPQTNEGSNQKDPDQSDTGTSETIPTLVELRAKAQEIGTTPERKKAVKGLLDEFGSKSISEVPEDQRAAFLKALEELA